MIMFNDPRWIPLIYHRRANRAYSLPTEVFGIIGKMSHTDHAIARKRLAPSFTSTNIQKLRPIVEDLTEKWISQLQKKTQEKKTFDFSMWTSFFTYDVLGSLCFGGPLGFLDRGEDVDGLIEGFGKDIKLIGILIRITWLTKLIVALGGRRFLSGGSPEDPKGMGVVMKVGSAVDGGEVVLMGVGER